jgi:hypothetical protein
MQRAAAAASAQERCSNTFNRRTQLEARERLQLTALRRLGVDLGVP